MSKLIPARYIAEHDVVLSKLGGPYMDGDGLPLQTLVLRRGSTLMMLEHEVIGCTWIKDPRHELPPQYLGSGRIILPEHKDLKEDDLRNLGYEFHEGRPDFEPVQKQVQPAPSKKEEK